MTKLSEKEILKKEWERSCEDLFHSYPRVFKYKPFISVGIGWHSILHETAEKAEKIIDKLYSSDPKRTDIPYLWDIKEKYGTLRISFNGVPIEYSDEIFKLEDEAEERSASMCETCGKPATLTSGGWIKTLCPKHS